MQAIFNLPSAAKAIAAFVILIRGLLTDQFSRLKFGDILAQQINQGVAKAAQSANTASIGQKLSAAFQTIGKKAGQGLSIGIAAALSGSALGSAQSGLDQALGIGSLLGSVAAGGAAFGPAGAIGAAGVGIPDHCPVRQRQEGRRGKEGHGGLPHGDGEHRRRGSRCGGSDRPPVRRHWRRYADEEAPDLTSFTTQGFTQALQKGTGEKFIRGSTISPLRLASTSRSSAMSPAHSRGS
jgi:hypothetical protein